MKHFLVKKLDSASSRNGSTDGDVILRRGISPFEIRFSHWIVRPRAVNIRLWFGQSSCQRHTSWQLVKVMTIIQWENRISKGEIPLRNVTSPSRPTERVRRKRRFSPRNVSFLKTFFGPNEPSYYSSDWKERF